MLTLRQMLKSTPSVVQKASRTTAVLEAKMLRKGGRKKLVALVLRRWSGQGPKHKRHKCSIEAIEPDTLLHNSYVKVSCDCVTGDTKVLTSDGWKTIYEIAQPRGEWHPALTYMINGKSHVGTAPFYVGRKPVWELKLSNGETLKATADHKILTCKETFNKTVNGVTTRVRPKDQWIQLKDLKVGSRLRREHYTPNAIDAHGLDFLEAFFIGVIMGDGSVQEGHDLPDLQIYKRSDEIVAKLEAAGVVKTVRPIGSGKRGIRVTFNTRAIELLKRYKFVNKVSVALSNEVQTLGYVAGLIVTDGRVYDKEVTIFGAESYLRTAFNELLRYGYSGCRLSLSREKGTVTNYGVATKDMYALRIGSESLRHLVSNNVFVGLDQAATAKIVSKKKRQLRNYVTVEAIRYVGRQNVYDISVPGVKRFVANSVIVHNCEAFCFWGIEYVLHKHGAADIKYSDGQPPDVRNPAQVIFLCPHLTKLALAVLLEKL